MSFLRAHFAAALLATCALASGCAVDTTGSGAGPDEHVASAGQATVLQGSNVARGTTLHAGDAVYSSDNRYLLTMQGDGNLVLYFSPYGTWTQSLWASGTNGNAGASAVMQGDGNFVVYDAYGKALWATGTNPNGNVVSVQGDGNVVVYDASGHALWASNTAGESWGAAYTYDQLCVYAQQDSASGTTDPVTLQVHIGGSSASLSCTLGSGVAAGTTQCCAPTSYASSHDYGADVLTLAFNGASSDGLRVGTVTARRAYSATNHETMELDEFFPAPPYGVSCTGCDWTGHHCGSCWLDGSGNGNCWRMNMDLTGGGVWSNNTGLY